MAALRGIRRFRENDTIFQRLSRNFGRVTIDSVALSIVREK